jgi:hypothetical protein
MDRANAWKLRLIVSLVPLCWARAAARYDDEPDDRRRHSRVVGSRGFVGRRGHKGEGLN